MLLKEFHFHRYEIPFSHGLIRKGVILTLCDEKGHWGCGEIAPLPNWSSETLEDALEEIELKEHAIAQTNWSQQNIFDEIKKLKLLPSVSFGLESALLSILDPLPERTIKASALLMGSPEDIIKQAEMRLREGYVSAKLKVGNLSFGQARDLIRELHDKLSLRIDANRAWETAPCLRFFEQFSLGTFDYVEEPFNNPKDLALFPHPLAVDESFPRDLTLEQLEVLPALKAIIYKPTIQGGMANCMPLHEWTKKNGIALVLSSSFESDLGLASVASLAHRLSLDAPVGIGTYHFLQSFICRPALQVYPPGIRIPKQLKIKIGYDEASLFDNACKNLKL